MTVEQHQRTNSIEILRPAQGFAIGLVAGAVMAIVIMAGSPQAGQGLWTFPNAVGSLFRPAGVDLPGFAGAISWAGLAIHFLMAGLLGALYASAQERIDNRSVAIIGLYYGFILWFVATFLLLSWLKPDISQVMRNWPMLAGHLAYGITLGLYAVSQNRPLSGPVSAD